ncbi:uncharacterized protein TRUGW13939_04771 [Talaromyces rugulosus]|uniref:Major facilitator superfamily (MFS) profile domain-containing protein n=1 Tax=Talaromyces rugulosus TaxID=121627 RepID=A0A7H8QY24_TALRU|nr:uncharacterized protein TRUGW13939_04771 [Talaromyces rugulosus]QKX57653.1 hypothetical protein TRUGW13939_04771 [Talaromyces rugulosus]
MFAVSIIAGPVVDAGYLLPLLGIGSLLTVFGMFMTSICNEYWQVLLAQAITMGLGFGCLYVTAPTIVSQYFDANTALAMGASSAGSALGGVIYPIIFTQLQPRVGFGWATRVVAFVVLATSVPPLILMRARLVPTTDYNLLDRTAFKDIPYCLLNVGLVFGFMGFYVIFYYIQLYGLEQRTVSPRIDNYLLDASSLPGRLIPGYYADRMGSMNVQTIVALIGAVLTFCLISIKSTAGLIVYCVLYGFSAGAFMGLPAAGVVSLSADKTKIGTRLGMTAVVGCGVLMSNPIAGAILNGKERWVGLIVWCGVLLVASSIVIVGSRALRVGFGLRRVL